MSARFSRVGAFRGRKVEGGGTGQKEDSRWGSPGRPRGRSQDQTPSPLHSSDLGHTRALGLVPDILQVQVRAA